VATPPPATTPSPVSDRRTAAASVEISRAELDRVLADFAQLTLALRGSFTVSGVRVDGVGDGTIFQRAGLRIGDVITAVDGVPLRSLDDAASVYARAASAKAVTAQIVRNGAPLTLRVAIR
jgi:S1-C subfamily serine protease